MSRLIKNNLTILICVSLVVVGWFGLSVKADNLRLLAQTDTETTDQSVNITLNPTAMTVSGCSAPYSLVTVFDNNLPKGTVVSDGAGLFSKYIILDKHGLHNVKTYAEDSLGLITDTVTKNISARDHFNNLVRVTLPPTVSINKNIYSSGQQITFVGMTCPNTDVNLNIDNTISLNVRSNSRGEWFAVVSSIGFSFGEHSFYVSRTDEAGNIIASQKKLFRIVKSQNDDDVRAEIDVDNLIAPTITSPNDNYLASGYQVTLRGTAQPNIQVEVYRDGRPIGSVFSNPLGEWTFIFTVISAQHSLEARACISYVCSESSNEVTIFYQGVLGVCNYEFSFKNYRFSSHPINKGLNLEVDKVSSVPPYRLIIDWGDDIVENTRLAENRSIKYHHVYKYIGNYNGIVTVEDSLGCLQTQYFSVEVLESRSALSWFVWLAFIAYVYAVASSRRNPFAKFNKH